MAEVWKDIPGYEGRYQVSDHGNVRSVDREVTCISASGIATVRRVPGRTLKPYINKYGGRGHLFVSLGKYTVPQPVHQLVLLAFVGPCPEGMEVCHGDGDPTNNRLDNLRYDTRSENIMDIYRVGGKVKKLTLEDIREITRLLARGISGASIARQYDVTRTTISKINTGRYKVCSLL